MKLYTDDYYVIGHNHELEGKPCQDHTLSGVLGGAAYAIIADGCSSGALTDIGARITSTSLKTAIRNHWNATGTPSPNAAQDVALQQRVILSGVRSTLGLSQEDMLATCAYAYVSPKGGLVHVRGDGVVALVYRGGAARRFSKFEWAQNAPLYPIYAEDEYASFIRFHGGEDVLALKETIAHCVQGDAPAVASEKSYTTRQGVEGVTIPLSADDMQKLAYIALMSDGAAQVDRVDWLEATDRLVSFKNAEGAFVKRRMIRFLKDVHRQGDGPLDDLSLAVIRIAEEDANEQPESRT